MCAGARALNTIPKACATYAIGQTISVSSTLVKCIPPNDGGGNRSGDTIEIVRPRRLVQLKVDDGSLTANGWLCGFGLRRMCSASMTIAISAKLPYLT